MLEVVIRIQVPPRQEDYKTGASLEKMAELEQRALRDDPDEIYRLLEILPFVVTVSATEAAPGGVDGDTHSHDDRARISNP